MRIGIYSTWDVKCGIAVYTKQLAEELVRQGHTVTILANYPAGEQHDVSFGEPQGYGVKKCWEWYGRTNKVQEDFVDYSQFDILHIQYESFLWHGEYFRKLWLSGKPFVVTYHSSCINPHFFLRDHSLSITHNSQLAQMLNANRCHYLPMPVLTNNSRKSLKDKDLRLVSFGLHRNDDKVCREAILSLRRKTGFKVPYETLYGDSKWVSDEELNKFLDDSRYVALLYPPVDAEVSSSAVCRALGHGSVVFTTDTKWFNHVKQHVQIIDNGEMLGDIIGAYEGLGGKEIKDILCSDWETRIANANEVMGIKKVTEQHVEIYKKEIARGQNNTTN